MGKRSKQSPSENAGKLSNPACGERNDPPALPDFSGLLAHEPGPELQLVIEQAAELERLTGLLRAATLHDRQSKNARVRERDRELVGDLRAATETMRRASKFLGELIEIKRGIRPCRRPL